MNDTPGVVPPPQEAPRKASRGRIIAMLALGGPVLAIGGCVMFLANLNFNSGSGGALSTIGGIGFVAGVLAFIVGVLWALVNWIDRRNAKRKAQP
jgi:hypothetical protein